MTSPVTLGPCPAAIATSPIRKAAWVSAPALRALARLLGQSGSTATPIRATPRRAPAAQARALVSLLQEQDHGTENQIRTLEMRQIHLELCEGLGWRPCKWNPLRTS